MTNLIQHRVRIQQNPRSKQTQENYCIIQAITHMESDYIYNARYKQNDGNIRKNDGFDINIMNVNV